MSASVIVIDLDHFKRVNDERGHHVGDRVLRTLGEILSAEIRNTDAVGRWGGEEFVLVCPGATLANAADLAEKLRHKIIETNFIPENPLPITASFGVATSVPSGQVRRCVPQADQALYLAKSRGRNCVVAANEEQMHRVTGARKGTRALVSGRFKLCSTWVVERNPLDEIMGRLGGAWRPWAWRSDRASREQHRATLKINCAGLFGA